MKGDFFGRIFRGDKGIWFIFMFLCFISVTEVFSATSQLAYRQSFWTPITSHCIHLVMGTFIVLAVHRMPYKWWKVMAWLTLALSIALLAYLSLFGSAVNGGARWIPIFGFTFQPSELAKLSMVIITAFLLSRMQDDISSHRKVFWFIVGLTAVVCLLIFGENISTAVILALVVFVMTIIGGVARRIVGPIALAGLLTVGLALTFFILTPEHSMRSLAEKGGVLNRLPTAQQRIKRAVITIDNPQDYRITDENRQISHALIAVSSSGIIGCGPGNSVQRDFLSQAYSDFIYSIIIEELGLLGGLFVLMLYVALLVRAGRIARKCRTRFSALLVMGCALMLVTQAMINMLIAVGLFPVTGQTLPLISRGGSSILISCIYIGIILNVSDSVERADGEQMSEVIDYSNPSVSVTYRLPRPEGENEEETGPEQYYRSPAALKGENEEEAGSEQYYRSFATPAGSSAGKVTIHFTGEPQADDTDNS